MEVDRGGRWWGWLLIAVLGLATILVPFVLWEEPITDWVRGALESGSPAWLAAVIGGLLAGDVVLPVPSSLVSTSAGYVFGFVAGTALNWLGMTAGCGFGYGLGATAARAATLRIVGQAELERVSRTQSAWGDWSLAALRAVPVLAEASVVYAGIRRMPIGRFAAICALANLGIATAYAAVGVWALSADSFLLAFVGAMALPAAAMGLARLFQR